MTIFQALVLSVIEGITEFLPISSTAHLIIAGKLLHIESTEFLKSFDVIIQFGAILAVATLYRHKLFNKSMSLWKDVAIAFIPTGIIGFALYPLIKSYLLSNSIIASISLVVGGIALLIFDQVDHKLTERQINPRQLIQIGLFQSLAMIPGVSRSAASIIGALLSGMNRRQAVEFSFFLAIPTMAAATLLDLIKSSSIFTPREISLLVLGFIFSYISAMAAIKTFVSYISNHKFFHFAIYRIIFGIIFLLLVR